MFRAKKLIQFRPLLQIFETNLRPQSLVTLTQSFEFKGFSTETGFKYEEAKKLNRQGRVDLAAAFRCLDRMDFNEGICNHLSLIAPAANGDGEVMLMIPYGYHWKEAEPDLLVGINDKGQTVEGNGAVETSARTIHMGIHKARPDARCAFHLHPPNATALGMSKSLSFDMYHQCSSYFYNDFAYDRDYSGLILNTDEGDQLAKQIGNKRVLFMSNHGVIVVGKSVAQTFNDIYYLERACRFQTIAMSTGQELLKVPDNVAKLNKEQYDLNHFEHSRLFFESMKRILKNKER